MTARRIPDSEAKKEILRSYGIREEFWKEMGKRIRSLREGRGLSRSRLSEWIGCDDLTLQRMESGRIPILLTDLLLLSRSLETPIEEILPEYLEVVKKDTSIEERVNQHLDSMDLTDGSLVKGLVEAMTLDLKHIIEKD